MTKGLTIVRLLAKHTSHRIVAADVEPIRFTSPGRYCRFISKFYRLDAPQNKNADNYIKSLLQALKIEKVDLWVSCSSVVGAVEDGEVLRAAQKTMGVGFRAMQFPSEVVAKLHEKDALMDYLRGLGLQVPESHRCTSAAQVQGIIDTCSTELNSKGERKKLYILKPIGVDDRARSRMMTLLPFPPRERSDLEAYLSTLNISPSRPFLLQQYIHGPEYCTHSLVVHGHIKAFVACPSSDLLMHYEALPPDSALNRKMMDFTKHVAHQEGQSFNGHLSFDFIVEGEGDKATLYPIECNPRAHTAVVLFKDTPDMAQAYLSCWDQNVSNESVVSPQRPTFGYYWIGHDLVTLLLTPFLTFLCRRGNLEAVYRGCKIFWHHLMYWRDGTFDNEDPWPFFVLYHVYWPSQFLRCLIDGQDWSRINVSTMKMFEC